MGLGLVAGGRVLTRAFVEHQPLRHDEAARHVRTWHAHHAAFHVTGQREGPRLGVGARGVKQALQVHPIGEAHQARHAVRRKHTACGGRCAAAEYGGTLSFLLLILDAEAALLVH